MDFEGAFKGKSSPEIENERRRLVAESASRADISAGALDTFFRETKEDETVLEGQINGAHVVAAARKAVDDPERKIYTVSFTREGEGEKGFNREISGDLAERVYKALAHAVERRDSVNKSASHAAQDEAERELVAEVISATMAAEA